MAKDKELVIKLKAEVSAANNALKESKKQLERNKQSVEALTEAYENADKRTKDARPIVAAYKAALRDLEKQELSLERTERKLAASKRKLSVAQMQSTTNVQKMSSSMQGASKASGAATSSVLELGRVIQDSNYGIRGMANNITQLASQLVFTHKSAGSLKGTLKNLSSAFFGSGGLLLVISLVVAALEKLDSTTQKVDKSIEALSEKYTDENVKLKLLLEATQSNNISKKELVKTVKKANEEFDDLNIKLDENKNLTEESTVAIRNYIKELENQARAKALLSAIEDTYKEIFVKETENYKQAQTAGSLYRSRQAKEMTDQKRALEQIIPVLEKAMLTAPEDDKGTINKQLSERRKQLEELTKSLSVSGKNQLKEEGVNKFYDNITKSLKDKLSRLKDFLNENGLSYIFGDDSTNDGKSKKVFKQRFLRFTNEIDSFNKSIESKTEINREAILRIQQEYDKKELENKLNKFKQDEEVRLAAYLKSVEDKENFEQLKAEAEKKYRDSIDLASAEYHQAKMLLEAKQAYELSDLQIQITNERINAELEAEQSFIDRKKRINETYYNWAAQAGGILRNLFEQDKAMHIAGIALQKGSAVAKIVSEANASIASQTAATATANAHATLAGNAIASGIAASTGGFGAAAGVAAGQAVAAGMISANNTMLGKNIAMTKITAGLGIAGVLAETVMGAGSRSTTSSSGGSGGQGGREFDFNLVGSTGNNQLAQAVGGQFKDQTVRAYVVGSDITNRQQLDNKIKTTATFGSDDD